MAVAANRVVESSRRHPKAFRNDVSERLPKLMTVMRSGRRYSRQRRLHGRFIHSCLQTRFGNILWWTFPGTLDSILVLERSKVSHARRALMIQFVFRHSGRYATRQVIKVPPGVAAVQGVCV